MALNTNELNSNSFSSNADREDFNAIVYEHGGRLFNTVFCMLGDRADAEDVVQEVFFRAFKSYDSFRGGSSIGTWLYRIAMNAVSDHIRHNKRNRTEFATGVESETGSIGHSEVIGNNPESLYIDRERADFLRKAVLRLPGKYRAVIVLKEIEGKSYSEISHILSISIGTVESRLHRARKMLQKELQAFNT